MTTALLTPKRGRGRPKTKLEDEEFFVWLRVNATMLQHPRFTVSQTCERLAQAGGEEGVWITGSQVMNDDGSLGIRPDRIVYKASTLRRLYAAALEMRKDPAIAAAWDRALAGVKPAPGPKK